MGLKPRECTLFDGFCRLMTWKDASLHHSVGVVAHAILKLEAHMAQLRYSGETQCVLGFHGKPDSLVFFFSTQWGLFDSGCSVDPRKSHTDHFISFSRTPYFRYTSLRRPLRRATHSLGYLPLSDSSWRRSSPLPHRLASRALLTLPLSLPMDRFRIRNRASILALLPLQVHIPLQLLQPLHRLLS